MKLKMRKSVALVLGAVTILGLSACDEEGQTTTPPVPTDTTPEVEVFTVSFNTNGGSTLSNQSVKKDATVSKPEDPVKEGYIFAGWFTDKELTQAYDFSTKVTDNITLYAKWDEVVAKYSVTFMHEDGTAISTVQVDEGDKVVKPENPVKKGYIFVGWYLSSEDNTEFDFNTPIISDLTIYARFEVVNDVFGYNEGIAIKWHGVENETYTARYNKKGDQNIQTVDKELVRLTDEGVYRVDILGLAKGEYEVEILNSENESIFKDSAIVTAYDRSGYAHFNQTGGVGAYNNDGTLKEGTVVVYVTDDTKNTVKAKIGDNEYIGLAAILKAQTNSQVPLDIRILGQINAATWDKIVYEPANPEEDIDVNQVVGLNGEKLIDYALKNNPKEFTEQMILELGYNNLDKDINNGITKLDGLTNKIKYDAKKKEFDSYYNMLDVSSVKNVTVEGVGTDAMLYQFGFTWKKSSSIEVRNLTFDDYTEDACSFEGADESTTIEGFTTGNIWVHNNTFNEGKNNWDVCPEQDKREGDGATDFKRNAHITLSYNHYYQNHKTSLIGGGDTQHTANITFHHNYYDECNSRLPLGRQANMHMYNNYYKGSTGTNMSLRGNAYAFIENCYFENVNNPIEIKVDTEKNYLPAAKVYGSVFENCTGLNGGTIVEDRLTSVENNNLYGKNFDTDSTIFYFDNETKKSKVEYMTNANQAKLDCIAYAGVLKR